MKAISIIPGTPGINIIETPEPMIASPTQVKIKILEVGICGTDREEVFGGRADAPVGQSQLIIGHEMLGRIMETGSDVTSVAVGDLCVLSVRRGCGNCIPCINHRSDMCYTGEYTERGIKGINGFETEFVVDDERYIFKVPQDLRTIGVLTEPMSVAQKAIDEALLIQTARLPEAVRGKWIPGKKALVAGLGAVGIMAAIALRLRGAEVIGLDVVDKDSKRSQILDALGGTYVDGRRTKVRDLDDQFGQIDFIFEAAGVADVGFNLIDALGVNGIYVMTGIPHDTRPVSIGAGELMTQLVLYNQILIGSVNAGPKHFKSAIHDLQSARQQWGPVIDDLITKRVSYTLFREAINFRGPDDIKTVIEWR